MADDPKSGEGAATAPSGEPSAGAAPGADQNAASSPSADQSSDQSAAPSSSAKGQNDEPDSLLDAVQRVVEIDDAADAIPLDEGETPAEEASPTSDPKSQSEAADAAKDAEDDPSGELTEADLAQFKPKAQKRIKALLAERDTYRQGAERIQAFDRFMEANGLSGDDVRALLEGGALLRRGDYEGFLRHAKPFLDTANQALGRVLPEDVQQMVDDGEVSEAAARELALARFQSQRAQAMAQEANARRDHEARAQQAHAVRSAVQSWEAQTRASDPDYDSKAAAVSSVAKGLMAGHRGPITPEAALAVARQAYAEVNGLVQRAKPPARPTRPSPGSEYPTRSATPEPKSFEEAALMGLRRAHAG